MEKQDYYKVLDVSKDATAAELKKAYRRLAMQHHPDRNQGDASSEAKFKEAKEAYDILSDQRKRATYDQFGHAGVNGTDNSFGSSDVGDIFDSVFGDIFNNRGSRQQHRGADLRYDLKLSLEEAVNGSTAKINVEKLTGCSVCNGSGAKKGSSPVICSTCDGHGQVRMQQGFFSLQQTCPKCRGQGKIITDPCGQCQGQGRVKGTKTISVKVPAGVDDGDRIRLSNEGEAGEHGIPHGDLYVHIHLREHKIFIRDNNALYCDVPISYTIAALGGELEIPTLDGRVKLNIPAETQTGKIFRLHGKGIKSVRSTVKGDLFCRAVIETPVNLTNKQKELFMELEQTMANGNGKEHRPKTSSWLQNVKSFFGDITH